MLVMYELADYHNALATLLLYTHLWFQHHCHSAFLQLRAPQAFTHVRMKRSDRAGTAPEHLTEPY